VESSILPVILATAGAKHRQAKLESICQILQAALVAKQAGHLLAAARTQTALGSMFK